MPRRQNALAARQPGRGAPLTPDAELRELLDHVARQLAEEYVRLMKEAAPDEGQARAAEDQVIQ